MNTVDIKDYASYVGITMLQKGLTVSPLKLQKILYYEQAWHMVGFGRENQLFDCAPQAWVNGPVYPVIYYIYKDMVPGMCDHLRLENFLQEGEDAAKKEEMLLKKMSLTAEEVALTERVIDEKQATFFMMAMDVGLKETVTDVKLQLREVYHNLLELDRQIISYLNLIEYQNRLFEKVQKLKYLRDQMLLETNTDIKAKMDARNPVWMEPRPRYTLKVSLSMLRTTDLGLKILQDVAKGKHNSRLRKGNLAEPLTMEELTEQQQVLQMVDVREVKTAFMASSDNLFHFVMNYSGYRKKMTEEEKLVLFCQIAAQYLDELFISEERSRHGNIEFPLIYPKTA